MYNLTYILQLADLLQIFLFCYVSKSDNIYGLVYLWQSQSLECSAQQDEEEEERFTIFFTYKVIIKAKKYMYLIITWLNDTDINHQL